MFLQSPRTVQHQLEVYIDNPCSGQTSEAPTDGKSTREGKFIMSHLHPSDVIL